MVTLLHSDYKLSTIFRNLAAYFVNIAMEKLKIGITQGDFNGVGYEIILKVISDARLLEICTPVIYGSSKLAAFYKKLLNLNEAEFITIPDAEQAPHNRFGIVDVTTDNITPVPGTESYLAGAEAVKALRRAVTDLKEGKIDALVTAPFDKATVQADDFHFPGHTEFLESELEGKSLMMMCSDKMRVALVTIHEPVKDVAEKITEERVFNTIKAMNKALIEDFALHYPRIAVLALNPHAGDNGLLGREEKEIIIPAIERTRQEKIQVFGPYATDGFFGSGSYTKFDGIVAMYHDQGLTPFKLLTGTQGVNYTAGLDKIRTSPDHGTAYDIAGKGVADETSLRNAIYMAIDIYHHRHHEAEATANPLVITQRENRRQKPE